MSRTIRRVTREVSRTVRRVVGETSRAVRDVVGTVTGANAVERAAREQADAIRRAQEEEAKRAQELEAQRKREDEFRKQVEADTEAMTKGELVKSSDVGAKGLESVTTNFASSSVKKQDDEDKVRKALQKFGR
jgi:hypothetical protein